MMKWIFSLLGYFVTRKFWGAIVGYFIGHFLEKNQKRTSTYSRRDTSYGTFTSSGNEQYVSPTDFELNLLSLCAIVIKADGRTTQQELDYVRGKFVTMYGQEKANHIFRTFNNIVKHQDISVERICSFMTYRSSYETRLQIIHFLFEVAQVDGKISDSELYQMERIARGLRISGQDYESVKAMFFKSNDDAYKILEISHNATDAEVKKAYREMAKKYHPDRVITSDEAIRKGAEEKFKKVQQAYEKIQKERNL